MQQPPGPIPQANQPDPGALAMQTLAGAGEISTIATAQLISGLSGLLVSEGLARVVRDIMGVTAPTSAAPATAAAAAQEATSGDVTGEAATPPGGEGDALAGLSAKAVKELIAQGVAGRIIALNSVNTYLSLATAEQLRRIGAQLATGDGLGPAPGGATTPKPAAQAPAPAPAPAPSYPYPGPVYWSQVPPFPQRWR